jgi:flagellar biosynthesis/type III secretory pathway protein FliH
VEATQLEEEVEATGLEEDLDKDSEKDSKEEADEDEDEEEEEEEEEGHEEGEEGHEDGARQYDEGVRGDRSALGPASSCRARTSHLVSPPVAPLEENRVVIILSSDG